MKYYSNIIFYISSGDTEVGGGTFILQFAILKLKVENISQCGNFHK